MSTTPSADYPADYDRRTVHRFAWFPVRLTGRPWYLLDSWVHLDWYNALEYFEPDCGVTTGLWVEIEAHPLRPL